MDSWESIIGVALYIVLTVFLCYLFFLLVIVRIIRKIHKFPIPAFATRLIDNADPNYPLRKTEKKWAIKAGLDFLDGFGNFFVYQLNFIKN